MMLQVKTGEKCHTLPSSTGFVTAEWLSLIFPMSFKSSPTEPPGISFPLKVPAENLQNFIVICGQEKENDFMGIHSSFPKSSERNFCFCLPHGH